MNKKQVDEMRERAIGVFESEHTAIAAVLTGMRYFVSQARAGTRPLELPLMHMMLDYITRFPERVHHPREDRYLFPALQRHTKEFDDVLSQLKQDHKDSGGRLKRLCEDVDRWEADAIDLAELSDAIDDFTRAYFRHLSTEETVILPAARRLFTPEQWQELYAAYLEEHDPLTSGEGYAAFSRLFHTIAQIAQS